MKAVSMTAWLLIALLPVLLPGTGAAAATNGDDALWWSAAVAESERDGYKLLDTDQLLTLVNSGQPPLIIDVRADYEFEAGHVAGAMNLEFDLGDRGDLAEAKRAAFEALAGQDRSRPMILYCRSFR
jgi:rhodanese-related sulfurtransferase